MTAIYEKKILSGAVSGLVFTLASIGSAVVQLRLVVEFLPMELAGIWLVFLAFGTYIGFLDLGLGPTLSREIGFFLGNQPDPSSRRQHIADLIATCHRAFLIIALLVFVGGVLLGLLFLRTLTPPEHYESVRLAWGIFALGGALNLVGGSSFAILYGLGEVALERLIRAASLLVGLALAYIALARGWGIVGLSIAWALQNLIARLVAAWAFHRRHSEYAGHKGEAHMDILRRLIGPSLKWAATSLGAILILQSHNIIIAATLGPGAIPPYEAIIKIAVAMMTLSLLLVTSSSPFISQRYAAQDMDAVHAILLRNVRISVASMLIVGIFVARYASDIVTLWLGPDAFAGYGVVWILLLMVLLETHHVAFAAAAMAAGKVAFAGAALLAGVMTIALSSVLALHYGLIGVAAGVFLAQLLTNNWYAPYVTFRFFGLGLNAYARGVLLPLLRLGAVCLAAIAGLSYLNSGMEKTAAFFTETALYMTAVIPAVWLLLLTEPERLMAKKIFSGK